MGTYRYILAVLVLLSHAEGKLSGLSPGVFAVISFYLISGYVMTLLIAKHYEDPRRIGAFYLDRCLRLFPQFIFYSVITLALAATVTFWSRWLATCTGTDYVLNFLMLPIGYYKIFGNQCFIIPQAWSLGLELTFYLVIPFVLLAQASAKWLASLSFVIFLAAYVGVLDTDLFGYRLLPGTLFMFLSGAAIAKPALFWRGQLLFFWSLCALMFVGLFAFPSLMALKHNGEVLLGFLVGLPALAILSRLRFSDFDEFAGNLSYGVFLNHFVFVYVFRAFGYNKEYGLVDYVILIGLSTFAAILSYYLVERPALLMRRGLRSQAQHSAAEPAL